MLTAAAVVPQETRQQADDKVFAAPAAEWWRAIGYFLCLALVGLRFYPALVLLAFVLAMRWRQDRYAFLIELTYFFGGFAFLHSNALPFKPSDLALVVSVCAVFIYRRSPMVSRILWLTLAYFAAIFLIATTSDESIRVQVVMMRNYFTIIGFMIPFLVFANRDFEWDRFIRSVVLHVLVVCGFYVVDTFLICGMVLVPGSLAIESLNGPVYSDFNNLLWRPGDFMWWPRHYPPGLYWMALCIVPLARRQLRLSWQQWLLVILSLVSCRTMTFMAGLLVGFICFRGKVRQALAIGAASVVAITGLYFADSAMGSPLRIASTVDQFSSLEAAADNEDLAEFGSGRMAQILPKWELLGDLHRYWLGLGFLHPTLTTNPKYQIKNEYYVDVSKSEETATGVEVTQFQTILDCGFLGLIVQTAFFVGIYFVIRRLRHSQYYLCVLVAVSVFGIGGFAGLTQRDGLLLLAVTLGAVLLANPAQGRVLNFQNHTDPLP
ncbi:MAG: hypothetical protein K2F82_01385 [Muribaculaceae bacterium]|nr:hypothetical protein [Muribaculaceae bacterium]